MVMVAHWSTLRETRISYFGMMLSCDGVEDGGDDPVATVHDGERGRPLEDHHCDPEKHSAEGDGPQGTACLGLLPGRVVKFDLAGQHQPDGSRYKVPQMGWNQVWQARPHPIWEGVPDGSHFYFVHSFYAQPSDARHSAGETEYGVRFTSALARDNIFATQFHPEKSADFGLALYRNFLSWKP